MAAPTNLFVNVNANSLASGLVRGVTDNTAVSFPELVIGDGRTFNLYFVDGAGNYAAWSGDASYIPNLAIGDCGFPTGGTFTLTYSGQTTAAIAYNASMAAITLALEALSNLAPGDVLVAGSPGQYFTVTFQGTKAASPQSDLIADFTLLTPASNINVFTLVAGTVSPAVNAVQMVVLAINPVSFTDDLTPITNGWTGPLSVSTVAIFAAMAAAGGTSFSKVFQVSVVNPDGSTTTLVKTAVTVVCTLVNPAAFAGTDAPNLVTQAQLSAAVLGLNNFTQETIASSGAGNSNVTRGSTSRHHVAIATITGAASTRTFSLLTSSSPNAGDVILLKFITPATAAIVLEVHNATSGGTLLSTVTTTVDQEPFFLLFEYSGSAWVLVFDSAILLAKAGNLAGIATPKTARANLLNLFANLASKTADFTIATTEDGYYYKVSTALGANVTGTLPNAATVGDGFLVCLQKTEGSPYTVATSPATASLTQSGQTVILRSNGAGWDILVVYNPSSTGLTVANAVQNLYGLLALTGGTDTCLDGMATANGAQPAYTVVMLSYGTPRASQLWQLVPGTDAATDGIIWPVDYNATTNPQVWKQIG